MWTQAWHDRANAERVRRMTSGYAAYLQGANRHCAAVILAPSREEGLRSMRDRGINGPVLAIHGSLDPIVAPGNSDLIGSYVSGARVVKIQGMGHIIVPEACPQIVNAYRVHILETLIRPPGSGCGHEVTARIRWRV